MQGQKDTQSQDCYKNHKVEPLHNSHQKSMYGLFVHGDKRNGRWREEGDVERYLLVEVQLYFLVYTNLW